MGQNTMATNNPRPIFEAEIEGQPVPQGRAKVTRFGTYYGKRSTAYRHDLTTLLRGLWEGKPALTDTVAVTLTLAGLSPRADLDNSAKNVMDALVDAGVLFDDASQYVAKLTVEAVTSREPSLSVRIEPHRVRVVERTP